MTLRGWISSWLFSQLQSAQCWRSTNHKANRITSSAKSRDEILWFDTPVLYDCHKQDWFFYSTAQLYFECFHELYELYNKNYYTCDNCPTIYINVSDNKPKFPPNSTEQVFLFLSRHDLIFDKVGFSLLTHCHSSLKEKHNITNDLDIEFKYESKDIFHKWGPQCLTCFGEHVSDLPEESEGIEVTSDLWGCSLLRREWGCCMDSSPVRIYY